MITDLLVGKQRRDPREVVAEVVDAMSAATRFPPVERVHVALEHREQRGLYARPLGLAVTGDSDQRTATPTLRYLLEERQKRSPVLGVSPQRASLA